MKYIKLLLLKYAFGEKHVNNHKDPVAGCTIQNTDFCLNGATCAPGQGFTNYGRRPQSITERPGQLLSQAVCESLVKAGFVHAKRDMKEFVASKQNVTRQWRYRGKLDDALMLISLS